MIYPRPVKKTMEWLSCLQVGLDLRPPISILHP